MKLLHNYLKKGEAYRLFFQFLFIKITKNFFNFFNFVELLLFFKKNKGFEQGNIARQLQILCRKNGNRLYTQTISKIQMDSSSF